MWSGKREEGRTTARMNELPGMRVTVALGAVPEVDVGELPPLVVATVLVGVEAPGRHWE